MYLCMSIHVHMYIDREPADGTIRFQCQCGDEGSTMSQSGGHSVLSFSGCLGVRVGRFGSLGLYGVQAWGAFPVI
jgi:hypothetical protein